MTVFRSFLLFTAVLCFVAKLSNGFMVTSPSSTRVPAVGTSTTKTPISPLWAATTTATATKSSTSEEKSTPKEEDDEKKKKTTTTTEMTREEKYEKAMLEGKSMRVGELKKELIARGISTRTFLEKPEFVKAYAEAIADNVKVKTTTSSSSSSSSSNRGTSSSSSSSDEPMDPSYKDVTMQKINPRSLLGQSIIDIRL